MKLKRKAPNSLQLLDTEDFKGIHRTGGKIRDLHEQLNKLREGSDARGGREITLQKALDRGELSINDVPVTDMTVDKLLVDIGIDKHSDRLDAVINLPQDQRWIVPELFLDPIEKGIRQENDFLQALIATTQDVAQLVAQQPQIEIHNSGQDMVEGSTGTAPEEGETVVFSSRSIKTEKFEKKVSIPSEVTQFATLDQLDLFLRNLAKRWGLKQTRRALDVLINGDRTDGANDAGVFGVEDGADFAWKDFTRVSTRFRRLGYTPTTVVATEDNVIDVMNITEFKNREDGTSLGTIRVQGGLITQWDFFAHSLISANQLLFLDPAFACQELVSQGMRVESERIMEKDLTATYVRMRNAFAILFRDARGLMDKSVTIAGTPFPPFMNPVD